MKISNESIKAVDRRLREMNESAQGEDSTTLLAACGLILSLEDQNRRLKLIADRLDEFRVWEFEEDRLSSPPWVGELVGWHNRLLRAVRQVQEIAKGAGDGEPPIDAVKSSRKPVVEAFKLIATVLADLPPDEQKRCLKAVSGILGHDGGFHG